MTRHAALDFERGPAGGFDRYDDAIAGLRQRGT